MVLFLSVLVLHLIPWVSLSYDYFEIVPELSITVNSSSQLFRGGLGKSPRRLRSRGYYRGSRRKEVRKEERFAR